MNELVFSVAGALAVFLIAVPAATLVVKAGFCLRRLCATDPLGQGSSGWYLLLIAPTLAPALWFVSAAVHQSEPGRAIAACIHEHLSDEACQDVLAFALVVAIFLAYAFIRRLRRELLAAPRVKRVAATSRHARRLLSIGVSHPTLAPIATRAFAVTGARDSLCTRGFVRTVIEVSTDLLDRLDDAALTAALLHEAEHARMRDPLRNLLASVSLSLNPLARLLRTEHARWRFCREALCDRRAVDLGAGPLALAGALVAAARPADAGATNAAATLGSGDLSGIRLRIRLLLGYAKSRPAIQRPSLRPSLLIAPAVLVLLLPHAVGSAVLDSLHHGLEHGLRWLGLP